MKEVLITFASIVATLLDAVLIYLNVFQGNTWGTGYQIGDGFRTIFLAAGITAVTDAGPTPWGFPSYASTLWGVGRPTGSLNVELLCVLGVQALPAVELHGVGAHDAPNRRSCEEPL